MLWEFFYDKGRDMLAHDIRSVLDYFTRSSNQRLDPEEKRILKTVLLLQAISQHAGDSVELFIPNEKNVDSAFEGTDLDGGASRIAERLVRDKVLFHKQLGGGKFQYAAYVNEVSDAELEKYKEDVDKKTTTSLITEQLVDKTTVAEAITLGGALKLRYELKYVSASDFDQAIRVFRNREAELENKIPAVVCFAKDDKEASLISKKIKEALQDGSYHIVFIDATATPFGKDGYEQYRNEMANAMYQQGKDGTLFGQYANNAKDALKKWKNRISSGEFIVFTEKKQDGERATTMDMLFSVLQAVNKDMLRDDASYRAIVDALVDFSDDAYVRHTEAVKRIATAYLKLLFPNVRTASDVNPKEFMKYCLRPAIKMRKIIWRQLSILDAEYKNDDKLMPEFTLKEIRNEA